MTEIIKTEHVISKIRRELKDSGDEKTRVSSRRFFKEKIKCYGVKTAVVKRISKENYALIKNKGKTHVFGLCEKLWQSGYIEESFVACKWSFSIRKEYEPCDFEIFKKWINTYVNNWASCDTLCNHTMGAFIEMYPEYVSRLKQFTHSDNRWMRRASAVSLIILARKGKFLNEIFEIADRLLVDEDDLVQKGYGWMLKVASHLHQQEVFDYVMKQKSIMPRTALRVAIEKMPKEMKRVAMEK